MSFGPFFLFGISLGNNLLQFFLAAGIELLHLGEDDKSILRVATQIADGVHIGIAAKGCTMCGTVALIARPVGFAGTLAHHTMADDQAWTFCLGLRTADGLTYLIHIVAIDFLHEPAPSFIFLCGVLAGHHIGTGGELYVVGIVEHDEVVESQIAGNTTCSL